jgi:putative nucleotidyltransferase with HDIG domain
VIDATSHPLMARAAQEERGGHWSAALAFYEEAFRRTVVERDAPLLREILLRQAYCRRQSGDAAAAGDILAMLHTIALEAGDLSRCARALNGLGSIAQAAGDLEVSEKLYLEARSTARTGGDLRVIGQIEQNLGILDNIRGRLEPALAHYRAGLDALRIAGPEEQCAQALNNLGMLYIDLDQLDEADQFFSEALSIAERLGDVVTAGTLHINRTELFLKLGDTARARASCDEGFELASRVENHLHRAEALKFYGAIYRATGKLHLAEIHLRQAVEVAADGQPLLEAEAQRELSLVLRELGRNREALAALNRAYGLFSHLQAQADQAEIHARIRGLEGDFLSLVRQWGESIEAKDLYTSGHCQRVAAYAERIARAAHFPEPDLVWFRMGAYLHDIGKVEVSAEILNKPGRLTDEEREQMERHTVIGDEMLATVEFPWDIRPMVRSHHERWDGTGYPDGLGGKAIHYAARILRLADVFDALTTARSYRRQLSPEEALALMTGDEGSFDPELLAVFLGLFPDFSRLAREAAEALAASPSAAPAPAALIQR